MTTDATTPEDDSTPLGPSQPNPAALETAAPAEAVLQGQPTSADAKDEADPGDDDDEDDEDEPFDDEEAEAIYKLVSFCMKQYYDAYERALQGYNNPSTYQIEKAELAGQKAYRRVMPPIAGEHGVACFLACVTHGLLLGAISDKMVGKLLYAAQVAQCRPQLPQKRPSKP